MNRHAAMHRLLPLFLTGALGACQGGSTPPPAGNLPPPDEVAAVPLGQPAGAADVPEPALSTANPYAGNPQAIAAGKALYMRMNCAGCHAYSGKGNMGPDLTDSYWRYGGTPVQIYKSIHEGRPQGMPAWGAALPPQEIWKLVAYIQSFGGSFPLTGDGHPREGDVAGEQVAPELSAHPTSPSPKPR